MGLVMKILLNGWMWMKPKKRKHGDVFRPMVTVIKEKKGIPTSVMFNGCRYALVHQDMKPKRTYKGDVGNE
jgi:hypothetical protein